MYRWITRAWAIALTLTVAGLLAGPASAEPAQLDPDEVEEFIDTRMAELMAEQGIPGGAVSVVADGEEVFSNGYGAADRESGAPVSPDTTFPTASVAKSFTAVAVLQLVEQGELDLDTDVNTYLPEDAQLPETPSGEPVTLHHLLTHTAGFEERQTGSATEDPDDALPLAEHVVANQPELVYPPGRFTAYSNYGIGLAGYILELETGQSVLDYAQEHIFDPLGMERTAFTQNPARFEGVTRYMQDPGGGLSPGPDLGVNDYPAGGAVTTTTDMSRFMLALLGQGELDGKRILEPASVEEMLGRQAEMHPRTSAVGYGSYERFTSDPRVVGHNGDFLGSNMEYALVPELDVGIFVAVNGGSPEERFQDALWVALIDEFLAEFLDVAQEIEAAAPGDRPLSDYAGGYHAARVSYNDLTMLPTLLGSYRPASVDGDGLRMSCSAAMEEQRWHLVGDGLFRSEDGREWAGYIEDDGEIVGLVCDSFAVHPYVQVDWHETVYPKLIMAGVAALVVLSMLAWPLTALARRLFGRAPRTRERAGRAPRLARWAAGGTGLLLAGALGTVAALLSSEVGQMAAFTGSPVVAIPLAVVWLPVAGVVALAALAWRYRWWGVLARAHYTAVAVAFVSFLLVAGHVNLVWTPWG